MSIIIFYLDLISIFGNFVFKDTNRYLFFCLIVNVCTFVPDATREVLQLSRCDVWVGLYLINYVSGAAE